MTSTTRTLITDSARARSLASVVIWLALTPGAGRSSKRVTTGPGCTATTSASTPKSRSLISTSRDIASSASGAYSGLCGGGSSSRLKGGSSPGLAAANSGTCRSFSTRSLLITASGGGSMRVGLRVAAFFCSVSTLTLRASRRPRPSAASRRAAIRARTQATAPQLQAPSRSMTVSQDTPSDSDAPAIQAARSSKVAPRNSRPDFKPLPTVSPTAPPAVCGIPASDQCSVASPQLATSSSTKPAMRTAVLAREACSTLRPLRNRLQVTTPIITGNRNEGRPKM